MERLDGSSPQPDHLSNESGSYVGPVAIRMGGTDFICIPGVVNKSPAFSLYDASTGAPLATSAARTQVGRGRSNNVVIQADETLSHNHATVAAQLGGVVIIDHSTNGTDVSTIGPAPQKTEAIPRNGRSQPYLLGNAGVEITFGSETLQFVPGKDGSIAIHEAKTNRLLQAYNFADGKPIKILVGRTLPQSDDTIILSDPAVSRTHAELLLFPDGVFRVHDLNSTNGTSLASYRPAQVEQDTRYRPAQHETRGREQRSNNWAVAEAQGSRPTMEDRYVVTPDFGGKRGRMLVGVFDGHGGADVAEFVKNQLEQHVLEQLNRGKPPLEALSLALQAIKEQAKTRRLGEKSGTTALVGLIDDGKFYLASIGDSFAVGRKNGQLLLPIPFRRLHTRNNPEEQERIQQMGGWVQYMKSLPGGQVEIPEVGVTRALGDFQYKRLISSEPFVKTVDLDGVNQIILASDGLWTGLNRGNEIDGEETMKKVATAALLVADAGENPLQAAELLIRKAESRAHSVLDNMTVVVLRPEKS